MKIKGGATIWARQTIDSIIFRDKPDKWFKIWFFIITKANHMDNKKFKRGEAFIKYEWISESTGATKGQIDHFIRWAKKVGMLATRKATRGMYINILKYEVYQTLDNYKSDTKSDLRATQERHKSDTINKYDKNDKNDKNIATQRVANLINCFKDISPTNYSKWFGNTTQRKSAENLLKLYPYEKLENLIINFLPKINVQSFTPKDTKAFSPYELERNFDKIKAKVFELSKKVAEKKLTTII